MTDRDPNRKAERTDGHVHPATARLARAIVAAIDAPEDPRSFNLWSQCAGASVGALRDWCRAAGIEGRAALGFARCLRSVVLAGKERIESHQPIPADLFLDIVVTRHLAAFMRRAGFQRGQAILLPEFLDNQKLISDDLLIAEVARALLGSQQEQHNSQQ